jgi:cation diffusion facilitator CzcD-associated flavoprotein CzcO
MEELKDITIIGAGPTGLFAAFYAGMRGASHRIIDVLDQTGGQLTALYPEKYIFDVAGFPKVLAKDLVKGMAEQALQWKQPLHLGEKVVGLRREQENGAPVFVVVTDRTEYPSRTVLVAGGIGAFTPRKLPLKDADRWYGKGLYDRVLNPQEFAGRRVLLVDDAISSGAAVERFTAALAGEGAEVVGVFVLVDMREVADTVSSVAAALPTESVSTYLEVLALAAANGVLDPTVHELSVDAIVNRWTEDDPRWDLLPVAA